MTPSPADLRAMIGRFACRIGWHKPYTTTGFDGCSMTGKCQRCAHRLLMDSQGNWFSVGEDNHP